MGIKNVFTEQTQFWEEQNISFFGIVPREWKSMTPDEVEQCINEDISKYWVGNPEDNCEMANLVYDGKICRNNNELIKESLTMVMNNISLCFDIFADFEVKNQVKEQLLIASIPAPCSDLTWIINKNKYTPRISAYRDYNLLNKNGNIVRQNGVWKYDINTGEFVIYNNKRTGKPITEDPFSTLTNRSIALLEAYLEEGLDRDNFERGLSLIPSIDKTSVFAYGFTHLDMFFDLIRSGKRFANPVQNIQLGVNTIFMKQSRTFDVSDKLIASKTPIFSLENFRTIIYKPVISNNSNFTPSFVFTNTKGLFDAFKTSTDEAAGRHRLLLDNVYCDNDMLYVVDNDGNSYNMFEMMAGKYKNKNNISSISTSLFCNNNTPKRIMMTSKLSAQAIPVVGQEDIFTNRVKARVVFGDFEGWSFADSILISESFAEKLKHIERFQVEVNRNADYYDIENNKSVGDELDLYELRDLFPNKNDLILKNYSSVVIKSTQNISDNKFKLTLEMTMPFNLGDKITNLHGSKGVVGKIIPDDEMPRLKNDIGEFESGPFEIIISGYSVLRRGSLGQIFEAWANASGLEFEPGEDFAKLAIEQYRKQMKEFTEQSVIEFKGEETTKPCGVIDIIRLYHHATTKSSVSPLKNNAGKMLNLGHMEKLNLVATSKFNILKELSIRSTKKHNNALWHIYNIMKNRTLPKPENLELSSSFARVLKSTGLSLELEGEQLVESDTTDNDDLLNREYERVLSEVSDNDIIDLDELYGDDSQDN